MVDALAAPAKEGGALRIDKLLWYLRLARSRALGRSLAEQGHIRLNGQRVVKAHHAVRPGDVLTLAVQGQVRVVRIERLPARRGPAAEAQGCYTVLMPASESAPSAGRIDGSPASQ